MDMSPGGRGRARSGGVGKKTPRQTKKTALKAKREALIMTKNPIEEILGLLAEHGADALPWDPDSPMVRLEWESAEEEADEK